MKDSAKVTSDLLNEDEYKYSQLVPHVRELLYALHSVDEAATKIIDVIEDECEAVAIIPTLKAWLESIVKSTPKLSTVLRVTRKSN